MDNVIDNIAKLIEDTQREYDREYKEKRLNIVTNKMTIREYKDGDDREGQRPARKEVTVMKYYTVKPKEYYTDRHYDEHYGTTYQRYTYTVKPRNFYTEQQLMTFLAYIDRLAGRTLEDDEKTLMLRYITNGKPYELMCVIDRTKELANQTMWQDR